MPSSTSFWNRLLRPSAKGAQASGLHAVLAHEGHALGLLQEGVDLHLVDRRRHLVEHHDVHQAVRVEVADADGAQLARLVGLFHRAPGSMHVAVRLVDQVQVQVVQLQAAQRLVDGLACALVAGVLDPELAGDEELVTRHAAGRRPLPTAASFM
jgi:hypothetical protein